MRSKLPEGWKEVMLGDIVEYRGEQIDIVNVNLENYVSTENMLPNYKGKEKSSGLPKIKTTNHYKQNDILISNIRPYFKKIWKADGFGGASSDILVLKSKEIDNDNLFIFYNLANDDFFNYIMSGVKGTKMPRGDKGHILKFKVNLPPLPEQKAIAATLSALDDKIELNNKINENLEAQAQVLFKHWFVDFEFPDENGIPYKSSGGTMVESELGRIPEGWEVKKLGEELQVQLGGTPARKNDDFWGGNINWINSGELNSYRIIKETERITDEGLESSSTKLWRKNTTVIAITGATLGKTSLLLIDTCANQSVVGILESDSIPHTYIYPYILSKVPKLIGHKTGGAQQHINKGNVEGLSLIHPPEEILKQYDGMVGRMFNLIENLETQNQTLSQLRDTLLPKLMSGQIRIPLED